MTESLPPLADTGFLQAFFDAVIPPSIDGRMPGGGTLGLEGPVAAALAADPQLGPVAAAGLLTVRDAALARDPGGLAALSAQARLEVVEAQLGAHAPLMFAVARHLYLAYYQQPRVLEGFGEPGRPPFPEGYTITPTDDELLTTLRARAVPKPAS